MTRHIAISEHGFFARLGVAAGGADNAGLASSLRPLLRAPGEGLDEGDAPEAAELTWPSAVAPVRAPIDFEPNRSGSPEPRQPAIAEGKPGRSETVRPETREISPSSSKGEDGQTHDARDRPETVRQPSPVPAPDKPEGSHDGSSLLTENVRAPKASPDDRPFRESLRQQMPATVSGQQTDVRRTLPSRSEWPARDRARPFTALPLQEPGVQQTTIEIHIGAIELRGRPASTSPAPVTAATAAPETGNQTGNLAAYLARRSRGGAT